MSDDATAALALLSRMRFACGDNGLRMQDELEEYLRGLAEDSARLDWLLANCATMDTNGFGDWRVAYEYTSPVSYGPYADGPRAAIDAAMGAVGAGGGE